MRDALFILFIVLAGTAGELAVTRAMKTIGEVHDFRLPAIVRFIGRALGVTWMWLGLSLMTLGFFALLTILSTDNVSFVVPVTALSYAAGALGGKFLLGETISPRRWAGVLLVCLGVSLVWIGR